MRLAELEGRENALALVLETIDRFTSGRAKHYEATERMLLFRYFSALGTASLNERGRSYLRANYQFARSWSRGIAHFLVSRVLGTPLGLRLFGVHLSEEARIGCDLVVVPGNRRVRFLDFATGISSVWTKPGFSTAANRCEVQIRSTHADECLVPVVRHSEDLSVIEEPLLDGVPFPRLFPWQRPEALRLAAAFLSRWNLAHEGRAKSDSYVEGLVERISEAQTRLRDEFGGRIPALTASLLTRLAALASCDETIRTTLSHGDFQPGNLLYLPESGRLFVTDWEFAARRSSHYDVLTWNLRSRAISGLSRRVLRLLTKGQCGGSPPLLPELVPNNKSHLALHILEDARMRLDEATTGRYRTVPQAWRTFVGEIERLDRGW